MCIREVIASIIRCFVSRRRVRVLIRQVRLEASQPPFNALTKAGASSPAGGVNRVTGGAGCFTSPSKIKPRPSARANLLRLRVGVQEREGCLRFVKESESTSPLVLAACHTSPVIRYKLVPGSSGISARACGTGAR